MSVCYTFGFRIIISTAQPDLFKLSHIAVYHKIQIKFDYGEIDIYRSWIMALFTTYSFHGHEKFTNSCNWQCSKLFIACQINLNQITWKSRSRFIPFITSFKIWNAGVIVITRSTFFSFIFFKFLLFQFLKGKRWHFLPHRICLCQLYPMKI
jgi:hypothetical protein